jgi:hypothetical protein
MRRAILIAAAFAVCAWSGTALAAKQLKSKAPVQVDPNAGYVMARIAPSDGKGAAETFMLYRIDPETGRLRSKDKKSINPVSKREDLTALIGGGKSYSFGTVPVAGSSASVFVTSLTPGEWVLAGTQSTCACMGSYRFTVRPGEVTDIGTIIAGVTEPDAAFPEFRGERVAADLLDRPYTVPEAMFAKAAGESDAVPATLASLRRVCAEYTATRFDNAGGWMVNRMSGLPPMDHESRDAAAAVTDPRYALGTSANRWPDVNDKEDAAKGKSKPR